MEALQQLEETDDEIFDIGIWDLKIISHKEITTEDSIVLTEKTSSWRN